MVLTASPSHWRRGTYGSIAAAAIDARIKEQRAPRPTEGILTDGLVNGQHFFTRRLNR